MNRSDRGPAVLALLVVIVLMLSHYSTRAALTYGSGAGAGVSEDSREIVITAKKYEYDSEVITVNQNERIKLVITALDHDHGFKVDAFHIDRLLKKGEPTTIEFTADTAGTFPFQCSHFCGLGHKGMKGELVLEADPQGSQVEQSDPNEEHFSNH
jgi:cytochrome c oxidase subunit II